MVRTLRRSALALAGLASVALAGCGGGDSLAPRFRGECATPRGTLAVGATENGTLTVASCRRADGSYADLWTLTLTGTTLVTLQFDLVSTEFDAFLFVLDSRGGLIVQDDDSGDDFNARIVHTFAPGTYRVFANGYDETDLGAYTLSLMAVTP
jgi:hypothetical protein